MALMCDCLQDYHWWWRSFIVSGGSAVYVFAYSIFYFVSKVRLAVWKHQLHLWASLRQLLGKHKTCTKCYAPPLPSVSLACVHTHTPAHHHCELCVCLLAGDHRIHSNTAVLWLHHADGLHFLAADWNHRLLCSLHLHQENLQCHQDWLTRSTRSLHHLVIYNC